jgi:hypothetical protein
LRTKIPNERITDLWSATYPKRNQPPIKAYYAGKKELNAIAESSKQGRGKYYQTRQEYGKKIDPKSADIKGAHYKQGKSHIILVRRQTTKTKTNNVIKHELKHIR